MYSQQQISHLLRRVTRRDVYHSIMYIFDFELCMLICPKPSSDNGWVSYYFRKKFWSGNFCHFKSPMYTKGPINGTSAKTLGASVCIITDGPSYWDFSKRETLPVFFLASLRKSFSVVRDDQGQLALSWSTFPAFPDTASPPAAV